MANFAADWEDYEFRLYEYDAERLLFKRVTIVYEHDAKTNQFVRVAKSIAWQDTK